jgi:hypothetical protein
MRTFPDTSYVAEYQAILPAGNMAGFPIERVDEEDAAVRPTNGKDIR